MSVIREYVKTGWKLLRRAGIQARLRGLVTWEPLDNPRPGYTVVIAAMHKLWPVLVANLRLVSRMRLGHMHELLVVFDCEEAEVPTAARAEIEAIAASGLRVRVLTYSPTQVRVARSIQWGWVYSWMSWSIGIGAASTRWVLLHDLDALPIDASLFEEACASAEADDVQFQGARYYAGCGVVAEMRLVTTFEMVLDAKWLRAYSVPYDGFNKVRVVKGRSVDFDTFLAVQRRASRRSVYAIPEHRLVHPSQLICQYTDHIMGRRDRTSPTNRLPILAYFMKLGNRSFELGDLGAAIADPTARSAPLWGSPLDIDSIPPATWAWMEKQIRRLEQYLFGATRPEIEAYLVGFKRRAGEHRTVGVESIHAGGVEDH